MHNRQAYLYVFNTISDWEYGYLAAELNTGRFLFPANGLVRTGMNKEYCNIYH